MENVDEKNGLVCCAICSCWFGQITPNHLKWAHSITKADYVQLFPNSATIAESKKNKGLKNPMKVPKNKEAHINKLRSEEYRNKKRDINIERYSKLSKEELRSIYGSPGELNPAKRPENRKKISEGVKRSYENNPELIEKRRIHGKTIGVGVFNRNAQRNYESGKWIRPEDKEGYIGYVEQVRRLTTKNYCKYFNIIKDAKLRSSEYHLDHKLSISFGYHNSIPPHIIAHVMNLEILPWNENTKKGLKCSISYDELMEQINSFEQND